MIRAPFPKLAAAILAVAIIVFLAPAIVFWISSRTNVAACLWGVATCSITLATYLLVLVSAATLIAAIWAGRWAFMTWKVGEAALAIERSTILGQRRCQNTAHRATNPDFALHIDQDCVIRDGAPEPTIGYDRTDYELISLGRSPIVNAVVDVYCAFKNAEPDQHRVSVGSMRSDASVHCTLWIHDAVLSDIEEIRWLRDSAECEGSLEFKPLPAHKPDVRRKRAFDPGVAPKGEQKPQGAAKAEVPNAPEGAQVPSG